MKWIPTLILLLAAALGCSPFTGGPVDGDYDGDGTVTFRDTERAPRSSVEYSREFPDVNESLRRHMDRQRDDYRERVREGEVIDY